MVVAGFGNGLTFPMTVLIVQRYTEDRLRGRAFTLIISAHNLLLGIAMVAAGALTEVAGPRWTYVVPRRCSGPAASPRSCSHAGSLQRRKWPASRPRSICRRGRTP